MCFNGYIMYHNLFNQLSSFRQLISIILLFINISMINIFVCNSDCIILSVKVIDGSCNKWTKILAA